MVAGRAGALRRRASETRSSGLLRSRCGSGSRGGHAGAGAALVLLDEAGVADEFAACDLAVVQHVELSVLDVDEPCAGFRIDLPEVLVAEIERLAGEPCCVVDAAVRL